MDGEAKGKHGARAVDRRDGFAVRKRQTDEEADLVIRIREEPARGARWSRDFKVRSATGR